MALTRWDPFKDLLFLQDRMSRLFDEALVKFKGSTEGAGVSWYPPVDIYETEGHIVLKAEVPGVTIESIDIEVNENVLTLKGERRFTKSLKEENYHRMERFYGAFERVFSLPMCVDKNNIKANLKDGVLKILAPKSGTAPSGRDVKILVQ
jgi:HSP20 family protein